MPSSLTWIDHDAEARERSLRILALFQEKESRDELGLGAIRDAFADQLFPGTSTIQTRLRYMLFVPWLYQALEEKHVGTDAFGRRADHAERNLIDVMRSGDERGAGVFGGRSGRQLKRLPSSVYWVGLGSWGVRVAAVSQDQYHRGIERTYQARKAHKARVAEYRSHGDDGDLPPPTTALTWHPQLPAPPADFPNVASFALTAEEAEFLLDRITLSHPVSLLAHLAKRRAVATVDAPWLHPDLATFPEHLRALLDHGRLFAEVMRGAALVYNVLLARKRAQDDLVAEYEAALQSWYESLDQHEVRSWSLTELWDHTMGRGHAITAPTRRFVEAWVEAVRSDGPQLGESRAAHILVERRERALKGARSRFANDLALKQWGGRSGLTPMTYRWSTASVFLRDLAEGLARSEAPC